MRLGGSDQEIVQKLTLTAHRREDQRRLVEAGQFPIQITQRIAETVDEQPSQSTTIEVPGANRVQDPALANLLPLVLKHWIDTNPHPTLLGVNAFRQITTGPVTRAPSLASFSASCPASPRPEPMLLSSAL